jgi:CRISPR-associated protein Cmr5
VLLRDQVRALHAYGAVAAVPDGDRESYEVAANAFVATLLRGGLAAAMAAIERLNSRGALLLQHLAEAGVPGLERATGQSLPGLVRGLRVDDYLIASREMREVASWLKRAIQATQEVQPTSGGKRS